jgi:hypothetical protein
MTLLWMMLTGSICFDECVSVSDPPIDLSYAECKWENKNARLVTFSGRSLSLVNIEFRDISGIGTTGSLVRAEAFTGDVFFRDMLVERVNGGNGVFYFKNQEQRTVLFEKCSFDDINTDVEGCISAPTSPTGQKLTMIFSWSNMKKCRSAGHGPLNGAQPIWIINGSDFESCTSTKVGAWIYVVPDHDTDLQLSIDHVTFYNDRTISGAFRPVHFEYRENSESIMSMRNLTYYWDGGQAVDHSYQCLFWFPHAKCLIISDSSFMIGCPVPRTPAGPSSDWIDLGNHGIVICSEPAASTCIMDRTTWQFTGVTSMMNLIRIYGNV